MNKRFTIQIKATICESIETDGAEPTKEQVAELVGRYVTLKNGTHFDSDEFEIIDEEDWDDGPLPFPGPKTWQNAQLPTLRNPIPSAENPLDPK